jgi:hypothetical protein
LKLPFYFTFAIQIPEKTFLIEHVGHVGGHRQAAEADVPEAETASTDAPAEGAEAPAEADTVETASSDQPAEGGEEVVEQALEEQPEAAPAEEAAAEEAPAEEAPAEEAPAEEGAGAEAAETAEEAESTTEG